MRRRAKDGSPGKRLIIPLILIAVIVFQVVRINRLNNRLAGITIYGWKENQPAMMTGREIYESIITVTPEYIERSFTPVSPFNDGKTLAELKAEFIKYGISDLYGSPRRTGDIRRIHEGLDLYVPENTPVFPVFPVGIVTEVKRDPNYILKSSGALHGTPVDSVGVEYGMILRVLYPEGIESLYAHLNEIFVEEGEIVFADTPLGLSGYTGNIRFSGKPSHLHIELRDLHNVSFDPESRLHYAKISLNKFLQKWQELKAK